MNRQQRRATRNTRDLYNEVTGRRTVLKEIPVSKLKVDESKLDNQLLQKMMSYETLKATYREEVRIYCGLTLNYLDSMCSLKFESLHPQEKENAISVIDLIIDNTKNTLEGYVLGDDVFDKVIESVQDVAKFTLTCFDESDIPLLLPLCDNAVKLLKYSYVIGAYIGEMIELTPKDIEYVKDYAEFMINKSLEIKAKN